MDLWSRRLELFYASDPYNLLSKGNEHIFAIARVWDSEMFLRAKIVEVKGIQRLECPTRAET